jgi:methionyl aminopeptidase
MLKAGINTKQLDEEGEKFIRDNGGIPTFKGYRGFPASFCISVNDVVVHGIPSIGTILKEGDIVSIDCGVTKNGFVGDSAYTLAIGEPVEKVKHLLKTTKESLYLAIDEAIFGKRLGDIGYAVQAYCENRFGYGVVRSMCGHGVGKDLHEEPEVPNYGQRGKGTKLLKNMVIAIEPMVNAGTREVEILKDKWTCVTMDRKVSAHFEHTVAVDNKARILTTFDWIEEAENKNINLYNCHK